MKIFCVSKYGGKLGCCFLRVFLVGLKLFQNFLHTSEYFFICETRFFFEKFKKNITTIHSSLDVYDEDVLLGNGFPTYLFLFSSRVLNGGITDVDRERVKCFLYLYIGLF